MASRTSGMKLREELPSRFSRVMTGAFFSPAAQAS